MMDVILIIVVIIVMYLIYIMFTQPRAALVIAGVLGTFIFGLIRLLGLIFMGMYNFFSNIFKRRR